MGLERGRQYPIAIGRNLIQAGDARREKIEDLAAGEQGQGRGIDRRVISLRVAGVDGGAEGVLIKGTALAEQGGARLASFGEGLVLLQPAQQAADVGLVPLVEAEFVIL